MTLFRGFVVAAILAAAGCSSSISSTSPLPSGSNNPPPPSSSIQHVIVMFQENRSFNTLFMGFPGAVTSTTGLCKPYTPPGSHKEICSDPSQPVALKQITLESNREPGGVDIAHGHDNAFLPEFDSAGPGLPGKMDGFDTINFGTTGEGPPAKFYPYAYVERKEVQPYWDIASRYTLGDHMFSTETSDSFPAHQMIIAGTTKIKADASLADAPSNFPWGCDAPAGTTTNLLYTNGVLKFDVGPFPCFDQYQTMADVLDAGNVSWRYYVANWDMSAPDGDFSGAVWDGFDAIKHVRYGPDWKTNVSFPNTNVFRDIKNGKLPQVSWVIPTLQASDHPASGCDQGPLWITKVVDALGESPYWKNTAIVITWDEWGGFYDPVQPPQLDYVSLGMRIPLIIVSPYAKPHYVAKTQYEFGSILKFIEQNFGTASLGTTDVRANSIADSFDFMQHPKAFKPFPLPHPRPCSRRATIQEILDKDGGLPD